ncbi:transcription initiation factor IIB [Natrialbaceae archaeon AArc-T1-2]|uniref:transcription initiation factor IIB n=1 Tax=Natrialbaceae archaeon AArc-T1-2 TaxID=3053904 RepID=UPI00255B3914|nr:TFIIB-type zinc ribbon-containing protein [Natrialbaceae archaeon AArc-T1-2]WIV66631.1 TFIIB-type zinc ribbon-containing protein [Natrialbaceae archaeon AArc-T1-2]
MHSTKLDVADDCETTDRTDEAHDCPECDGPLVAHSSDAELVCDDCGLVVDADRIDHGPEWRAFDPQQREERSRVGAPTTTTIHDRGLSTRIDWRDKDAGGSHLSEQKRRQMNRLRTWNERFRTQDASERNLKQALGEIDRMASALGIPESARETASVLYRRALEENLLPGRSIEGMATATLHAATRQAGFPRSVDELATVSRVERLEVTRTYRYLVRELELPMEPPDPLEYVGRYASALEVSGETERLARELLESGKRAGVHSGKHPVGLAASSLYAAAQLTGEDIPQHEISEAADVSEVTIRNRYRELLEAHADES